MTTELDLGWIDPRLRGISRQEPGPGSGLCRAVGARLGVDPVLVRVIVALLALSGGLGVALYLWGTALTTGPTGARPIYSILPSFSGWARRAQQAAVIVSSLALVAAVSSITPLPWFPGVLLIALLVLARRRQAGGPGQARTWTAPTVPGRTASPSESDDALVARWRATMGAAAGPTRLPVVDLYAPAEPTPPPPAPRARTAWLTGTGLLALSVAGGVGAYLLLDDPVLGLGAGLILAGLLAVIHAVVSRRSRIPRPVLVVMVAGAAVAGWLAAQAAVAESTGAAVTVEAVSGEKVVHLPQAPEGILTVEAVTEEGVVDLTQVDLTGVDEIRVDALMADLTVVLPGSPDDVTSGGSTLAEVLVPASDTDPLGIPIVVDATLSSVTLEG